MITSTFHYEMLLQILSGKTVNRVLPGSFGVTVLLKVLILLMLRWKTKVWNSKMGG